GRLTDRWGADRTLLAAFALMAAAIAGLALLGLTGSGTVPVWLIATVLGVYGFAGWGFNSPMNARSLQMVVDAGAYAVALNSSCLHVGISIAGAVGGAGLARYGRGGAAAAAAGISLATVAIMAIFVRAYPATAHTAEEHATSRGTSR